MLSLTEKQSKRLSTIIKFNEEHPNEYCWSHLVDMALCKDREMRKDHKDSAKTLHVCKQDLKNNGSCWCGKFTSTC